MASHLGKDREPTKYGLKYMEICTYGILWNVAKRVHSLSLDQTALTIVAICLDLDKMEIITPHMNPR